MGIHVKQLRAQATDALKVAQGRFTFPLSCLGIGLVSAWTELNCVNPPITYAGAPEGLSFLFDVATIIVATIIAIATRARADARPLVWRKGAVPAACVLLITSTSINFGATAAGLASTPLIVAAAAIGGAGVAMVFVMWWDVVSRLSPAQLVLCYAVGAVGRVAIIWLLQCLPLVRLWVCLIAVALLMAGLLCAARKPLSAGEKNAEIDAEIAASSASGSGGGAGGKLCAFPLKPLLIVVVGSLSNVFIMQAIGNSLGINGNPGVLIAASAITLVVLWKGDAFHFQWLWQASLACIVAAVVAFAFFGGPLIQLSGLLAATSYEMCLMLTYAILGNLVYRYFYNSTFLFSVEIAVALTASHIGEILASLVSAQSAWNGALVLLVVGGCLTALFVVVVVRVLSADRLDGEWSTIVKTPIAEDFDLALEKTRLGIRCHELAQEYDLSRREEEVLLLLARRLKPAQIAEELCIEVSTVNTHRKHIYRKMDVHSIKELLARIGGAAE